MYIYIRFHMRDQHRTQQPGNNCLHLTCCPKFITIPVSVRLKEVEWRFRARKATSIKVSHISRMTVKREVVEFDQRNARKAIFSWKGIMLLFGPTICWICFSQVFALHSSSMPSSWDRKITPLVRFKATFLTFLAFETDLLPAMAKVHERRKKCERH